MNREVFDKPEEYYSLDKLRKAAAVVPEKFRTLVPEYIKDYVSLNQFAAQKGT